MFETSFGFYAMIQYERRRSEWQNLPAKLPRLRDGISETSILPCLFQG